MRTEKGWRRERSTKRKINGVYYTPRSIVERMVEVSLGRWLAEKSIEQVAQLRILDPACGEAVFLLVAYAYLLNWHLKKYQIEPDRFTDRLTPDRSQLTQSEKARILFTHLYGVDLDRSALVLAEGRLLESLGNGSYSEDDQRRLRQNLRWGNAVIGPDFATLFPQVSAADRDRLGLMDWAATFPEVMQRGGFDLVIGNPPYVDSEWMTQHRAWERCYCAQRYRSATGNWDLFCVFCEQAIALCRAGGLSSLIVPNKLASAAYAGTVRSILVSESQLLSVSNYAMSVFPVAVYPIAYLAQKMPPDLKQPIRCETLTEQQGKVVVAAVQTIDYALYSADPKQPWPIASSAPVLRLIEKLRAADRLDAIAQVQSAATVSEAYAIQPLLQARAALTLNEQATALRFVNSGVIDRYGCCWQKPLRYLQSDYQQPMITMKNQAKLPAKRLAQARQPKLILASMTQRLEGTIDRSGNILAGKSTVIILPLPETGYSLELLAALLNSKLLSFYYRTVFGGEALQGGYLRVSLAALKTLPIAPLLPENTALRERLKQLVELTQSDRSLDELGDSLINPEIDEAIDCLIYDWYQLSDSEIAIVENSLTGRSVNLCRP